MPTPQPQLPGPQPPGPQPPGPQSIVRLDVTSLPTPQGRVQTLTITLGVPKIPPSCLPTLTLPPTLDRG